MLLNGHEVSQNLRRMELISQSVPHRHAGMLRQIFHSLVRKAAKLNTVKHPAEYLGSIFNCLFLTQLDIVFTEIFWRNTEVVSRHRKGAARPGRGFLKQQRHIFSLMNPMRHTGIFQPLIFTRRIQ